jgi:hypothetical protein
MYLRIFGSFKSAKIIGSTNRKSANRNKYMVHIWQIRKLLHLRKLRKSKKIVSSYMRICDLWNLRVLAVRLPLKVKDIGPLT